MRNMLRDLRHKPWGVPGAFLTYGQAYPKSAPWIGAVATFKGPKPTPEEIISELGGKAQDLSVLRAELVETERGTQRWEDSDPDLSRLVLDGPPEPLTQEKQIEKINQDPPSVGGHMWRLWILKSEHEGDESEFGLYFQVHHALLDGLSMSQLGAEVFGPERPKTFPGYRSSLPETLLGAVLTVLDQIGIPPRGALPVNGSAVSTEITHIPLETMLQAKQSPEASLNDVALAALTVTLQECGVRGNVGVAVPVNVRKISELRKLGNYISTATVRVECDGSDAVTHLARYKDARRKGRMYAKRGAAMAARGALHIIASVSGRYFLDGAFASRSSSLMLSNVPPVRQELSVMGCPAKWVAALNFVPRTHQMALTLSGYQDMVTVTLQRRIESGGDDRFKDMLEIWKGQVLELAAGGRKTS